MPEITNEMLLREVLVLQAGVEDLHRAMHDTLLDLRETNRLLGKGREKIEAVKRRYGFASD